MVSEDGYKRSWARTADTVVGGGGWSVTKNDDGSFTVKKDTGDLAAGDQVLVVGTLKDGDATAQRIASRPDGGEIPGMIMKRFEGEFGGKEFGDRADAPMLKERMLERFGKGEAVPGPMGGPGGEIRKFEFRTGPDGEAPSPGATPAEPSATSSGYVKTT